MIAFIENFLDFFRTLISIAGPVIIMLFTLAILSGFIKWSYKTRDWLKIVSSNPIFIVIWIAATGVGIYFLYKYFPPL